MQYSEENKKAIARYCIMFKIDDTYQALLDRYNLEPNNFGCDMRINGYHCANCNGYITHNTMKFFDFSPDVLCYDCQNKSKNQY